MIVLLFQAEAVVLMSDRYSDTSVLLGSFELEQVMEEIAPGKPRPKVRHVVGLSGGSSTCVRFPSTAALSKAFWCP